MVDNSGMSESEGAIAVWICATCGNQYPPSASPPDSCIICTDERQWVPPTGQVWTSAAELRAAGHVSDIREIEPGLIGIGVNPAFAIGQRALLVRTPAGNLLWDAPGFVDDAAIQAVRDAGGIRAISASHPHFYASIAQWSVAFDAEILLPEADERWLTRSDVPVTRWSGSIEVLPGVMIVQCGGHFAGSSVLHWADGAGRRGALLSGDTIFVTPGEDRVAFARSAPNRLPLPERRLRRLLAAIEPYRFDRIYSGWWTSVLHEGAKEAVARSAERYIRWLNDDVDDD